MKTRKLIPSFRSGFLLSTFGVFLQLSKKLNAKLLQWKKKQLNILRGTRGKTGAKDTICFRNMENVLKRLVDELDKNKNKKEEEEEEDTFI